MNTSYMELTPFMELTPLQIRSMRIKSMKKNIQRYMKQVNNPKINTIAKNLAKEKTLRELSLLDMEYQSKVERMIEIRAGQHQHQSFKN